MNMERLPANLQQATELGNVDRILDQAHGARMGLTRENAWANLKEFQLSPLTAAQNHIVTRTRSDPAYAAFDLIRTKLMQAVKQNGWRTVAITSPTAKCGKSLVALNLAFSLANLKECRTLLMDMDFRDPCIATMLDMKTPPSMEALLRGDCEYSDVLRRYDRNLAIGANKWPVNFSSELLQSSDTTKALRSVMQAVNPDVVLYDTTSMLYRDDVTAFLPNVDCAILVVAAEHSTFAEVDACERELAERTNVLGVVLNKSRYGPAY